MDILDEMADWAGSEADAAEILDCHGAESSEEITDITQNDLPDAADSAPADAPAPVRSRRRITPAVWILAAMALASAMLLAMAVILALPYMKPQEHSEDPQAILGHYQEFLVTEAAEETILEPTISETQEPTIPPARNPYDRYDFQYDRHNYLLLQNARSSPGVDVSAYQGVIDWKAVRASGIEFAIIRLGYRGYETGKLVEDEYARANLQGAAEAGLRVGAYFFSQAISIREADEELAFMTEILGDTQLTMPLVLDWEIPNATARSANMDKRTLTDIQRHFCAQAQNKGYTPMIYFNWHQSENLYVLSELEDYPFWLALYQDRMTYPWKIEMWQWTDRGTVPGIQGPVDLNVYLHY